MFELYRLWNTGGDSTKAKQRCRFSAHTITHPGKTAKSNQEQHRPAKIEEAVQTPKAPAPRSDYSDFSRMGLSLKKGEDAGL